MLTGLGFDKFPPASGPASGRTARRAQVPGGRADRTGPGEHGGGERKRSWGLGASAAGAGIRQLCLYLALEQRCDRRLQFRTEQGWSHDTGVSKCVPTFQGQTTQPQCLWVFSLLPLWSSKHKEILVRDIPSLSLSSLSLSLSFLLPPLLFSPSPPANDDSDCSHGPGVHPDCSDPSGGWQILCHHITP